MSKIRIAIIGGGASGLFAAAMLNDVGADVVVFEKNNKLGKKILASGNGKCNFTNTNCDNDCYNHTLASTVIEKFTVEDTLKEFSKMGLIYKTDDSGRCYPVSECAISVLDCLKGSIGNVVIKLDCAVQSVAFEKNKIELIYNATYKEQFDYLICCSGSLASNLGSDKAYSYLKHLNLSFNEIKPSLVPVVLKENVSGMSGVRVKCIASLIDKNNKVVYSEKGEIIFKDNGISGISIFNISSYINRKRGQYKISLDISSGLEIDVLKEYFKNKKTSNLFKGFLNDKIADYIYDCCGVIDGKSEISINRIVEKIKNLEFNVVGLYPLKDSQVCSGGVALEEINENLSLRKFPSIYIAGELLDVDGLCGGYNLQFAWSSAGVIAKDIERKIKK